MARYIDADTMRKYAWNEIQKANKRHENDPVYKTWSIGVAELILALAKDMPTVDAVPVVRCRDCVHSFWDEKNEMWKCVESAEYDSDFGDYIGFVEYHNEDFYCADGERKDNG